MLVTVVKEMFHILFALTSAQKPMVTWDIYVPFVDAVFFNFNQFLVKKKILIAIQNTERNKTQNGTPGNISH